jgi:Mce-associated membrane protein
VAVVPGQRKPFVLVSVLLVVALLGAAAAYLLAGQATRAAELRPSANLAYLDQAATEQVRAEVGKAVEAVYSYDTANLDDTENRALSFITGSYGDQFRQNFSAVRALGPQSNISLSSKVVDTGVEMLTDRRATLLMMVNQVGRRGDSPAPLTAQIRLTVTAEKVGGQWKVSDVDQR